MFSVKKTGTKTRLKQWKKIVKRKSRRKINILEITQYFVESKISDR